MSDDKLDWMEMLSAAMVGVMRQIKHRRNGDAHRWNTPLAGGWERDVESACAEKFAAKRLGLYWFDGLDGATDVGPHQVRHTSLPDGRLMLHPDDADDEAFILVIGRAPAFELIGWCFGHEGKRPEYWEDPSDTNRWAFFVPRRALHPMDELPSETRAKTDLFA
jgi:hypothetical protein